MGRDLDKRCLGLSPDREERLLSQEDIEHIQWGLDAGYAEECLNECGWYELHDDQTPPDSDSPDAPIVYQLMYNNGWRRVRL